MEPKDYKHTLNLPKTDFPMKAGLPQSEPARLKSWQEQDIYASLRKSAAGKEKKILHDGPPYANGNIHLGHVLNKTLKDIVVKYWSMRGFDAVYIPGWDCHGLPIEHQLLKEMKLRKHQVEQIAFREKAYEYALKYVGIQREQFERLGIFGDWQHPYLTLERAYEKVIVDSFAALLEKGYIYRGAKPVNWCFECETALAEAEVEYEEHVSPSVGVKFPLNPDQGFPVDTHLVIWTTTPWTLMANVAVAVHPQMTYVLLESGGGHLVLSKDLYAPLLEKAGAGGAAVVKEFKGTELEGLTYTHPFGLRQGRVVLADYVSREEGTGLVHIAPGHGQEDFLTGMRYNLEVVMPVDKQGRFDASIEGFTGEHVLKANEQIIEKLREKGLLLLNEKLSHSYPHCWRCKKPIIFRATDQWFLSLAHEDLRGKLIRAIDEEVRWIPASGRERIRAMVALRPDWCLSRQRYWGVPIPSVVCTQCNEEFLDTQVLARFSDYIQTEGTDCWFRRPVEDFTAGLKCPACGAQTFTKGVDILDVWFDSGVSHQAVFKSRAELGGLPCELYLEGSDQHRGWFQSSLIPAVCLDGKPPFKKVLTHGFVVDGAGRKMSKSLGNVIAPQDIIKDYGADILRLWVASSDYNEDIRISKEILSRLTEAYRKIRNTARFMLSNLSDFDPAVHHCGYAGLRRIDSWILSRLYFHLIPAVNASFEGGAGSSGEFEFYRAYKAIYDFCNQDLSMHYLDMAKGRLYTCSKSSPERRSAQSAVYEVLHVLVRLLAPFLAFTADEIWQYMPRVPADREKPSVHLSSWPGVDEAFLKQRPYDAAELEVVLGLKPEAARMLEELRGRGEIGSSFDARIILLTNSQNRYNYLHSLQGDLAEIFKVSQVALENAPSLEGGVKSSIFTDIALIVQKALGAKCPRCWNYYEQLAPSGICESCLRAVEEVKSS